MVTRIPLPPEFSPRTIPALMDIRAEAQPDHVGFRARFHEQGRERRNVTLADWADGSRRVARGLADLAGVGPGTAVAWLLGNDAGGQALLLYHAVLRLGALNVPVNTRLAPPEVRHILAASGARVCVATDDLRELVTEAAAAVDAVRRVVIVGDGADLCWEDLLACEPLTEPTPVDEDSVANLLYTSGTTGAPKGVLHSHASSLAAAIGWADAFRLGPDDRLQSPFPIFSGAGLHFNALACLWSGASFVLDGTDVEDSLDDIEEHRSTVYVAVPSIYQYWLDSPTLRERDLGSLRILDYGGASMPPATIEAMRSAVPSAGLMQTYGLTEGGPGGTYLPEEYALTRLGSIGNRAAGRFTDFRVVDDDGRDVGPGEIGEFVLRGPSVMLGYHDDPEATAAAFLDDVWLRSGDIVRVDEAGFLHHLDRKKDLVVRGGYNVASPEVEAALLSHPAVAEVAVVGRPHPRLGEDVAAFVVLRAEMACTEQDLVEHCRERLADFKRPRTFVFLNALPRNAAGKVRKPDLRSFWNDPERIDQEDPE